MGPLALAVATAGAADLYVGSGEAFSTLSEAVEAAASGDRILVRPGTYTEHVAVDGIALEIVAVDGPGTVSWRASGEAYGPSPVLWASGAEVTLTDLELDGAQVAPVIYSTGSELVLSGTSLRDGAAYDGALLHAIGGTVDVAGGQFTGGVAASSGGAVHGAAGATITIVDSRLEGNQAADGAAIYLHEQAVLTLVRGLVCGNVAGQHAVTAETDGSEVTVTNSLFYANEFDHGSVDVGIGTVVNNHFVANRGVPSGGTVVAVGGGGHAEITNNLVVANDSGDRGAVALGYGGAVSGGYNLFYDNVGTATEEPLPGELYDVDPGLPPSSGWACDFEAFVLPEDSPATDAGDPGIVDLDGSRADIGLFGGPEAPDLEPTDGDADADADADADTDTDVDTVADADVRADRPSVLTGAIGVPCGCRSPAPSPWIALLGLLALRRRG